MLFSENKFIDCNERALEMFRIQRKVEFCKRTPRELSPPIQHNGQDSLAAASERVREAYRVGYNRF